MYPYDHQYQQYTLRNDNNRIVPFAGPFLLGALTGGVAVAAFNPYRPRPYYGPPRPYYVNPGYGGFVPF